MEYEYKIYCNRIFVCKEVQGGGSGSGGAGVGDVIFNILAKMSAGSDGLFLILSYPQTGE